MKRVLLIVLMMCFFTAPSISQTNHHRTPFCKKGKWGYVDEKEKVIIKAKYQEAGIFNNGYAIVKKNNKYGIIDYKGKVAVSPVYDYIERLDPEGYFTKLGDKYGILSVECNEITQPKYDSIERLDSNGYLTKLGGKYGILSVEGNEIIPPIYDSIQKVVGNITLQYITKLGGKYGILSADGNEITPHKYDYIELFGRSLYLMKLGGKYRMSTADGVLALRGEYDYIGRLDSKVYLTKLGDKYGILSADGNDIIQPIYDSIERLDSNRYLTKLNGRYGLISSTCEELLLPHWLSLDLDKLKTSNSYQIAKTFYGGSHLIQTLGSSIRVTNVNALENDKLFELFKEKILSYNDIAKGKLAYYIEYQRENTSYNYQILRAPLFEYSRNGHPNLEVEQNNNIYTYPRVFTSEDKDIIFYNTKVSPGGAGRYSRFVGEQAYHTHYLTMDKIMIGNHSEDIQKCFSPLFKNDNIQLIEPIGYIKNPQHPDKLLLTVNATYAGKPRFLTYTQPHYRVICGKLWEFNSGIHYYEPTYKVGHLCLVNTSTMNSELITLEGISDVLMKYDKKGEYLYFMNESDYRWVISQNQSPIYVASMNEVFNGTITTLTAIIPEEGDVITDIQRSIDGEYIYLCGSTTKQGYVGYENGIFIILKKHNDRYEEIARYRSKNKDRYYKGMEVLDNENVCLFYDNYSSRYGDQRFDIINIPSIINKEQ